MRRSDKSAGARATLDNIAPALFSVVSPFIAENPALGSSLGLVVATLGAVVMYRQERFNHFVQHIIDNPDVYTQEILQSEDFQDGLVAHFDSYFRLRGEKKLQIAHQIFYDFAKSDNMPVYPLERYDDTLAKISDAGIRLLGFIETEVPNIIEDYLASKMRQNGNSFDEDNIKKMRKAYIDKEPLSKFIEVHIDKEVHLQMQKHKNSKTPLAVESEIKQAMQAEFNLVIGELEQLGLVRTFTHLKTMGWSGDTSESGYNMTHYGRMFISVIKPSYGDKTTHHS